MVKFAGVKGLKSLMTMNGNEQNNHRNMILSALTIIGDVAICVILYMLYCRASGFYGTAHFGQTAVTVGVIYFTCVLSGGVILFKRNVKDFQVPMLVLRNVLLFTVACLALLSVGGFYILPAKLSLLML